MKIANLVAELNRTNIIFQRQSGFMGLIPGIASDERIVCATVQNSAGFSGRSFWLYGDETAWYLGLWSGIYFKFEDPAVMVDAVVELLRGTLIEEETAPGNLPKSFVEKYRLELQPADIDE